MSLKNEFIKMIMYLNSNFAIPLIADIFLPPFYKSGQPKNMQFMAVFLEGGATGISYILIPVKKMEAYNALRPQDFIGKKPQEFALEFGNEDPVRKMISLASINAICQHVMKETNFQLDYVTDPLGLLSVEKGKRWTNTTLKTCFQKKTYRSIMSIG